MNWKHAHLHEFLQTGQIDVEYGAGARGADVLLYISAVHKGQVDLFCDVGCSEDDNICVPESAKHKVCVIMNGNNWHEPIFTSIIWHILCILPKKEDKMASDGGIGYIYAFSRCFYPKRLTVHSGYTFICQYMCSLGFEPTTFALLTQCSTTEPQEHYVIIGLN